jgi:solute carrier family 39 (zinc transporter), member 7
VATEKPHRHKHEDDHHDHGHHHHHGHDHDGEKKEGCPFAKMFGSEGGNGEDPFAKMNKQFGLIPDSEYQRTLPKVETNPHKRIVNYLIKVTKAEKALNFANALI